MAAETKDVIVDNLSTELIAGRLGIKPESLPRAFAKLRSMGMAVHASHVAEEDVAWLRQLPADDRGAIRGMLPRGRRSRAS